MPVKNLLFLSYGEDLLQNKILQNQFAAFATQFDREKYGVHVHSAMPISRTRLFKRSEWRSGLAALRQAVESRGGKFSHSTLPGLSNWLYSNLWQFLFFHHLYFYLKLARYVRRHRIQYVYCRGYHAALVANLRLPAGRAAKDCAEKRRPNKAESRQRVRSFSGQHT